MASKKLKCIVSLLLTETHSWGVLLSQGLAGNLSSNGKSPNNIYRRLIKFLRELYWQKHWVSNGTE
jgi:hypothetical protein